jgi:RNA polymerase sigma-70 factor (ECF subfamily)
VGWLWTIAARRLVDAFRRRARQGEVPIACAPLPARSAEDEVLHGVLDDGLASALRHLAPELRQVVEAVALDGLSVRETSTLLGIPQGTVKTRARRARLALREALS